MVHKPNKLDIVDRSKEIDDLIMNHDLNDAGMRLLDFCTDFDRSNKYRNEIIIAVSMLSNLEDLARGGRLQPAESNHQKIQYLNQMLEIKEKIERKNV
ncbi:MAG: hypothetical protein GY777_10485 [Candidatus Brocadiaceae bacterium]|nr:hypothetical protein [Candidatus Brocadiaceae bacterium]